MDYPDNTNDEVGSFNGWPLISIASGYGLVLAFLFEAGVCEGYGLPGMFVTISTETLMSAISGIGMVFLAVLLPLLLVLGALRQFKGAWAKETSYQLFMVSLLIILFQIYGLSPLFYTFLSGWIVFMVNRYFHVKDEMAKGKEREEAINEYDNLSEQVHFWYLEKISPGVKISILGGFFFAYLTYYWGIHEATSEKRRTVLNQGNSHCLVAKKYADNFLCIDFDPSTKILKGSFKLIPVSNSSFLIQIFELKGKDSKN